MTCDLLLRGDLVLEDRVVADGVVTVSDGRIDAVLGPGDELPEAVEVHDFSGRYLMPGVVDTHVHAGSFETEDLRSTTASAAYGGVTTIVDMPYDRAQPVMGAERLAEKVGQVRAQAIVDVGLYGTMPKNDGVRALRELLDGGVCAFKFSLFEYDAYRFPRIADGDLLAAFEALAGAGVPVVLHNELQEIVEYRLAGLLDGRDDDALAHGESHPPVSETAASAKALDFAYWTGARLHLAHCTHPHTFRLIDFYQGLGAPVSGETCVHYLLLTEGDVARLGAIAKVNPPIRDEAAHEQLWELLREGRIATVSTDHAPWPSETKQRPILRASAGMPGLETFLAGMVTAGLKRGFPLPELLGYLTWRPAEVFGLAGRKGRLAVGLDADVAVFDARAPWTFHAAETPSAADWSAFDGWSFAGRVEATYVRGRRVFEHGRVVGPAGGGQWLQRPA
jgi:allantoinase